LIRSKNDLKGREDLKKIEIKITYDADKFAAVKRYMEKKDVDIMAELESSIGKLYEKYVPQAVREFIEQAFADTETEAPSKQKKAKDATESSKPALEKAPPASSITKDEHPDVVVNAGPAEAPQMNSSVKVERPPEVVSAGTMKMSPENSPFNDVHGPAPRISEPAKTPLDSLLSEPWQRKTTI